MLELLRDASLALAERGAEEREWVLEQLEAQESGIFERLRLHLLVTLPDEAGRRAAALADPDTLFSRERLGEVYRLLPVGYADLDEDGQSELLTRIEEGPDRNRYGLPSDELDQLTQQVEAWQDEWRQRLLSALESQLHDDARQRLQALRDRRGQIERPGFAGVQSRSWVGPRHRRAPRSSLRWSTTSWSRCCATSAPSVTSRRPRRKALAGS